MEMMNVYKAFSGFVSTSIQINGEAVTRTTLVKLMRRAKRDTLNLIDTFVTRSNNAKVGCVIIRVIRIHFLVSWRDVPTFCEGGCLRCFTTY